MNCACIDVDIDGDGVELLRDKLLVSWTKKKVCGECRRLIFIGEKYRFEVFQGEGKFDYHITCADCNSLRENMFCGSFYYGGIIGEIECYVSDADGDMPESCLAALTPGARARVCELIERVWSELD